MQRHLEFIYFRKYIYIYIFLENLMKIFAFPLNKLSAHNIKFYSSDCLMIVDSYPLWHLYLENEESIEDLLPSI